MSEKNIWNKMDETYEKVHVRKNEKVIYLGKNGDGSDGLRWETAFTNFSDAYDAALTEGMTTIMVGAGVWDMASEESFYIQKPLHIKGVGQMATIFKNTLALYPDRIFDCWAKVIIEDCGFEKCENASDAIMLNWYSDGSIIRNCHFNWHPDGVGATSGHPIDLSATKRCIVENCRLSGVNYVNWGIYLASNVKHCLFRNIYMEDMKWGVFIEGAGSDNNRFENMQFINNTIGLRQTNGSGNTLNKCEFTNCTDGVILYSNAIETSITDCIFTQCTSNINDGGNGTELNGISSTFRNEIYPENLTGVTLPNSGVIGTYGANTVIIPAETIDKPFKLLAYTAAPSDDKKFIIRLSDDSGVTHFMHMMDRRDGNNGELGRVMVEVDRVFAKGTEISASIQSEVTDETVEIWLYIQKI